MQQDIRLLLQSAHTYLSLRRVQLALVILATVLLYLQAAPNQLVLDDDTFVNWPVAHDIKNIPYMFTGILPEEHIGDFRPLKGIILAVNYRLWGASPLGYILQAILIHMAAVYLVYRITDFLVRKPYVAFITSLVFALHPVQVEAVAFITASSDTVGLVFYLAAFYAFLRWFEARQKKRTSSSVHRLLLLSLIFFGLGLLSYEMVFTLPLMVAMYVLVIKKQVWRRVVRILMPYMFVFGGYFLYRYGVLKLANDDAYQWGNFWGTLLVSVVVLVRYLQLAIWPLVLQINHRIMPGIFAYRVIEIHPLTPPPHLANPYVVLSVVIIAVTLVVAWNVRRKAPLVTFGIGWFFLSLLPILNLYPLPTLLSERYLYLAMVGFSLVAGLVSSRLLAVRSSIIKSGCLIFLVGLFLFYWGRSYLRILDWRSSETLWKRELGYNPHSMLANHNLGMAYFAKADMPQAVTHLQTAANLNWQGVPKVYLNLGKAYLAQKDFREALDQFRLSTLFSPQFAEGHFYAANANRELGNTEMAKEGYFKTLEIDPTFYDARVQLAQLYFRQGQFEKATGEMERVIAENPQLMPAYYDLAAMLIKLNRLREARLILEAGLKQDPKSVALLKAYNMVQEVLK